MLVVFGFLLAAQRHEIIAVHPLRQFRLHLRLAPAQHQRPDALVQLLQIPVGRRPPALVQLIILPVEPEKRSKEGWVKKIHQGIKFIEAVLNRRSSQDESIAAAQPFDRLRGFRAPILDPLRFVQDHHIRTQPGIDLQGVGQHLLVIDDGEKGGRPVGVQPRGPTAKNQLIRQSGETLNLLFPFRFQRSRSDDQDTGGLAQAKQKSASGDGLNGFPQAHFVGQQRPFREGQVEHPLALVRKERDLCFLQGPFAALHLHFVLAPQLFAFGGTAARLQPRLQFL